MYIELGSKGATEVINDISQRFLTEQARFKETQANKYGKADGKLGKDVDPSVNVIGFMLTKMAESNEYVEQLIQSMLDEVDN